MFKEDQLINYLAVNALEAMGLKAPNQVQLDCFESNLKEWMRWTSLAILALSRADCPFPSALQVKEIAESISNALLTG